MPTKKATSPKGKSKSSKGRRSPSRSPSRSPKKSSGKKTKTVKLPREAPSLDEEKIIELLTLLDREIEDESDTDMLMASLFSYMEDRDMAVASISSIPLKKLRKLNNDIAATSKAEEDALITFTIARIDKTLEGYEPMSSEENSAGTEPESNIAHYYNTSEDPVERVISVIKEVAGFGFYVFTDNDKYIDQLESDLEEEGLTNNVLLNKRVATADDTDKFFVIYLGIIDLERYKKTVDRLGDSHSIIYTVWKTGRKSPMKDYKEIAEDVGFKPTLLDDDTLAALGVEEDESEASAQQDENSNEERGISHFIMKVDKENKTNSLEDLIKRYPDTTFFIFGADKKSRLYIAGLRENEEDDDKTLLFFQNGDPGDNKYAYGYVINYNPPEDREDYEQNIEVIQNGRVITFVTSKEKKSFKKILEEEPELEYTELDDIEDIPAPVELSYDSDKESPRKPTPNKEPSRQTTPNNQSSRQPTPNNQPPRIPTSSIRGVLPTPSKLPPPQKSSGPVRNVSPSNLPPPPTKPSAITRRSPSTKSGESEEDSSSSESNTAQSRNTPKIDQNSRQQLPEKYSKAQIDIIHHLLSMQPDKEDNLSIPEIVRILNEGASQESSPATQ